MIYGYEYEDLTALVGTEIGADTNDTLTSRELEECCSNVQAAALDTFPHVGAEELFWAIDQIAAAEYGIRWS